MKGLRERLKSLREKDLGGDTVEVLAKKLTALGVKKASASTVSRYETTDRLPPVDYLAGMAFLTGRSLEEIVWGEEVPENIKALRLDYIARVIEGKLDEHVVGEIGPDGRVLRKIGDEGLRPTVQRKRVKPRKNGE